MHFNENIILNAVAFTYGKEGKYKQIDTPFVLNYDDIVNYGDGWVLAGEETVPVTESHKQIMALIDGKKKEKANYDRYLAKLESMGFNEGDAPGGDD